MSQRVLFHTFTHLCNLYHFYKHTNLTIEISTSQYLACIFFYSNSCTRQLFFVPLHPQSNTYTVMAIKTTELIRTSQSWDGAILPDFPKGKPELRVIRLDFPVGAKTGWHHHTVVNYGIVQQGELTIVCQDGSEKTFHEGEPLVEVIGTIHRGENRGSKPVILNMFYFSLPGEEITIQHPELEHEQKTEADTLTDSHKDVC